MGPTDLVEALADTYDLARFRLSDMISCSATVRRLGAGAASMEEAAGNVVRHLYDHLVDPATRRRECALVRIYKTHPFGELDASLQAFARGVAGTHELSPESRCLVLLATVGDQPAWNARATSVGHRAIPLASEEMVGRFPMISQLVLQLGLAPADVVQPRPGLLTSTERTFNVFYVPHAAQSRFIPAQRDFVAPCGIESVLGFGGAFPSGDLYAAVLFSRVAIPAATAELFKTLALGVELALLPFVGRVFGSGAP